MKTFQKFIGKNWFTERETLDAQAKKAGFTTNLKVKGDRIHASHIELLDVDDIDVDDHRLTITIEPEGKIIGIFVG